MADPPAPDDPEHGAALARHAETLVRAAEAAIPGWVERCVTGVLSAEGRPVDAELAARTAEAAAAARADGVEALRRLLTTDIDEQRTNPLSVLRSLVRYPTEVLAEAGARPVARDDFAVRAFPDDVYDLSPAAFADVDPALHLPGLVWGAAKAHVHLNRRRHRR